MRFIVAGMLSGGMLSIASIGFTFFWGISGIINLSQGAFVLLGSYCTWWLVNTLGFPLLAAAVVSIGFAFLVGYSLQRSLISKVVTSPSYPSLLLTFGIGLGITSLLSLLFGADYRSIPSSFGTSGILAFGSLISLSRLLATALAIALIFAITSTLNRSRPGLALKAIANSKKIAQLSGLPVQHYLGIASGIATALASFSGIIIGISQAFSSSQADQLTLLISVSAVVGKLGNLWGALFASMAIGIADGIVSQYLPQGLLDVFALGILVIVLSVRSRTTIADFIRPRLANGQAVD